MAIASAGGTLMMPQVSPEERQLKNERKRVNGYMRAYQRSPENWNPSMIASLERLTTQYGIPFQRIVPKASTIENIGAGLGGAADALLMDFVPDDWYSSESTRTAKNIGKGIGTAGAILATGGAAIGAKGAIMGSKALATGARALGKAAAYTPTGQMSKQAIGAGIKARNAYKGLASTDDILAAVNKAPGQVGDLVKGKALDKTQLDEIVTAITDKHGKGSFAQKMISQVKAGGAKPGTLTPKQIRGLVDDLGGSDVKLVKPKAKGKGKPKATTSPQATSDSGQQQILFDNKGGAAPKPQYKKPIGPQPKPGGTPKGSAADVLEKAGKNNNLTPKQIKELADKLNKAKINTADEAADWLIQSQKALEEVGGFGAINYIQAGTGAAMGAGALSPLAGIELSREEKMAQDLDPYN